LRYLPAFFAALLTLPTQVFVTSTNQGRILMNYFLDKNPRAWCRIFVLLEAFFMNWIELVS
jgi:hypothetical protein